MKHVVTNLTKTDKAATTEKMARAMATHESKHIKGSWTGLATAAYEAEHG